MHPKYPNVFSPIKIGPVELRNRFYSSPHGMPCNIGSKPTDDYVHYNAARAKGGLGLIMVSLVVPERTKGAQPCPSPRENIPAFRAVADAVHDNGGKIFAEPFYQWCAAGAWQILGPSAPALAPSVSQLNFIDRRSATREMTKRDIRQMLDKFRQATENLREAGFDGIMLHASHGAHLEQFLSPYYNRRKDEYGGILENRMRLLIEELEVVREAAGEQMAVGMRLNCDELLTGGYDTKEAYKILQRVSDSGLLDFVDLDIAVEPDQFYLGMPPVFVEPHFYQPYVEAVRKAAGNVPVLSVLGRLTSVKDAEKMLEAGVCDMVGAARAIIAEPYLVKNAFNGNEELSRTCIACNECMASMFEGAQGCAINPSSYRERYWGPESFTPAPQRLKVVIVGAGPSGLEAARVSALRGHEVVLMEARAQVGGALRLWANLPGREFYQKAVDWWWKELNRLDIEVLTNTQATLEVVLAQKPDAVILATGAGYSAAGYSSFRDFAIPGHDRDFVYRPEDILCGGVKLSGRVVMLDAEGLHTGVGVAEALAGNGAEVTLLTPYFSPMSARLVDTQDAHFIIKRLLKAGVNLSPMHYIKNIGEHQVTAFNVHSDEEYIIDDVDAVVLSTGRLPENEMEKELDGKVAQLFTIGDALAPRVWSTATYEGHKFARLIGEPGGPTTVSDIYFSRDDIDFMPFPADLQRTT